MVVTQMSYDQSYCWGKGGEQQRTVHISLRLLLSFFFFFFFLSVFSFLHYHLLFPLFSKFGVGQMSVCLKGCNISGVMILNMMISTRGEK